MKLLEKANNMVAQANARAQRAEDQVRILAGRLEAQRQTVPSDGPSSAIHALMPLSGKEKKTPSSDAMDVFMPLEVGSRVGSRKGKEREEAPYDGGDESEANEEEEV